jgi:2-oxoglutarate dehydrogenase E2 component (dihydrolipoamide succinyltransferase)
MPTDVIMPQMGESIFEGTITKWLKNPGDPVEKDEPLFEISTDKVDAEIPAPVAGVLTEIKVPEGETVVVNTVVAVIGSTSGGGSGASGGTSGAGSGAFGADASAQVAEATSQASTPAEAAPALSVPPASAPAATSAAAEKPAAPQTELAPPQVAQAQLAPLQEAQVAGKRIRSSPLVRRIAQENQLDLGRIAGSGLGSRITKEDVLRHLAEHGSGGSAYASPVSPATLETAPQAQLATPQVVPLTKMRAIIAQRMVESVQTSPHAHTVYKVDMTRIARLREREKARYEQQHGVKLTYMPFIAAAAVEALAKFPIVNASLAEGAIHYHRNVNLGIAVALEWGLIVPVIKQAEERSFLGLARAIADLAARARTKKLLPDEATGSTFTLTNSGVFGGEFGTAIINQPESAILAIGGLRKEPVVLTDAEGNDTIAIRSVQYFCLGFDHRTIDGADAGRFMSEFKQTLEGWKREIG